jgi:hypothetical protein
MLLECLRHFPRLYSPLWGIFNTKSLFVWVVHQFQCKAYKESGDSTVTLVSMLFLHRLFVCDGTTVGPTCNIRSISKSSTGCNLLSRFTIPVVWRPSLLGLLGANCATSVRFSCLTDPLEEGTKLYLG